MIHGSGKWNVRSTDATIGSNSETGGHMTLDARRPVACHCPEQNQASRNVADLLISLVRPKRFERSTSTSGVLRSILLSYGRAV
jgi:hypothetical protein